MFINNNLIGCEKEEEKQSKNRQPKDIIQIKLLYTLIFLKLFLLLKSFYFVGLEEVTVLAKLKWLFSSSFS